MSFLRSDWRCRIALLLGTFTLPAATQAAAGDPRVQDEVKADFDGDGRMDIARLERLDGDPSQQLLRLVVELGGTRSATPLVVHLDDWSRQMRLEARRGGDVRCPDRSKTGCGRPYDAAPGNAALVVTAPGQRALIFHWGPGERFTLTLGFAD